MQNAYCFLFGIVVLFFDLFPCRAKGRPVVPPGPLPAPYQNEGVGTVFFRLASSEKRTCPNWNGKKSMTVTL